MGKITKFEEVEIAKIKPYENNAKIHTEAQIEKLCQSIDEFGFLSPCLIDSEYNLIAGHGRVMAAQMIGWQTVPCVFAEGLTEAQRKAYILADNKLSEMAEWDKDLVSMELEGLKNIGFDIDVTGFDIDDIIFTDDMEPEMTEEVPEVDEENEPITQFGDIYQLGRHRLMCGDSTDKQTVEQLMNGNNADLVFTDPPYGMKKEVDGVLNDNLNYDDLLEFNKQWVPLTFKVLKENGSWYCWGIDEPLMDIYSNILKPMQKKNKITFRNLITWDKGIGQGQNNEDLRMYPIADEKCLFVMCGCQGFNNNSDNYFEGWEPIRTYLEAEAKKSNLNATKLKEICGVGMYAHWFTKSQWALITEEHYKKIQNYCVENEINAFGVEFGKIKKQYDEIKKQYDEIKKQYDEIKKQWYETRAYFNNTHDNMNNVWHFDRTSQKERELTGGHATPKPIALCSRAIKSSSRENEIVLDVFGGSGSTLIACEILNRNCYTMELDPKYCDVIIKRWENLTGEKAVKIHG